MASREQREAAIRDATERVRTGNAFMRRAAPVHSGPLPVRCDECRRLRSSSPCADCVEAEDEKRRYLLIRDSRAKAGD